MLERERERERAVQCAVFARPPPFSHQEVINAICCSFFIITYINDEHIVVLITQLTEIINHTFRKILLT